jgi:hypothetical protein
MWRRTLAVVSNAEDNPPPEWQKRVAQKDDGGRIDWKLGQQPDDFLFQLSD